MKDKNGSDEVWIDMLTNYDYSLMLLAVKQYISDGNEYAPSIASLILYYKKQQDRFSNDILQEMEKDGIFDDCYGTDIEIALWNKLNRKRKAQNYVITGIMPGWFEAIYQNYQSKNNIKLSTSKITPMRIDK